MEPRDKLYDILWNGLQADIFEAEESLALVKEIGGNASAINEAKYGFGNLFGRLQHLLTETAVLAVSRIYDKPKGYPLRSLPSAIELLKKNSATLKLIHRSDVIKQLIEFRRGKAEIQDLTDKELTDLLAGEYQSRLPSSIDEDLSGLYALKFRRDKKLAHPEAISAETHPPFTYGQIEGLLALAKDFVAVIGFSYLEIVYKFDDGEYFLSRDAEGIARPLRRLLQRANILTDSEGSTP